MSFLDQMRPRFSSAVRHKGESCFAKGLVDIKTLNSDKIEATVTGNHKYEVRIQKHPHVEMSCTCPYFLEWEENCKHLWATLIEAEQRGCLIKIENKSEPAHNRPFIIPEQHSRDWRVLLPEAEASAGRRKEAAQQFYPFFILDRELSLQRGQVILKVEERYLKKNGEWGKCRSVKFDSDRVQKYASSADQKAMELIFSLKSGRDYLINRYSYYDKFNDKTIEYIPIPPAIAYSLLPILEATERLYIRINEIDKTNYFQTKYREIPLKFASEQQAWQFKILVKQNEEGQGYRLDPFLTHQDRSIQLAEPDIIFSANPHWFVYEGLIQQISTKVPFYWIWELRKPLPIIIDKNDISEFFQNINQKGDFFDIFILPTELEFAQIKGLSPTPELCVTLDKGKLCAHLNFRYYTENYPEDYRVDSRSSSLAITDFNRRVQVQRDSGGESAYIQKLRELGFNSQKHPDYEWTLSSEDDPLKAIENLLKDNQWRILGRNQKKVHLCSTFRFTVTSGVDWFDLHGGVEFEGQSVPLQKILELQKKGEQFVVLGDGTLGVLPQNWLQQNRFALTLGQGQGRDGDTLRFSRGQTCLLDLLLNSGAKVWVDEHYRQIRDCLQNFQGIQSVDIPSGFLGTLRPYQKKGLDWLLFLHEFGFGGCLADDMGLGKTIQILALMEYLRDIGKKGPSLVVVPTSLVFNWQKEAQRFTPHLRVLPYTGSQRRKLIKNFSHYDLIITTYGILRRDIVQLQEFEFSYLILDEAQVIKNHQTQVAKASSVIRARHRLSLTGTPLENHLGELWSQFEFLNPSLLGSYEKFQQRFGNQLRIQNKGKVKDRAQEAPDLEPLKRLVHPFMLRRTKKSVELELPDKSEQIIYCDMTEGQRSMYNQFRDLYRASLLKTIDRVGIGPSRFKVLEGLLRLRQICCHPMILAGIHHMEKVYPSGKFMAFQEILTEVINGEHKALVFSQFTSMLRIMRRWLDQDSICYQYLDGHVRDRDLCVSRFQEDQNCKLFLISLKAGGFGLNLTAADYVFIYDPWWNPAVEMQAVDRTHRIGQKRRVFTYRFITKNSVEEKIQYLQEQKRVLVQNVIQFSEGFIKNLTKEDIMALFS